MTAGQELIFYIGTYNSEKENAIHWGAMDRNTGELRLLGGTAGIENPTYLDFDESISVLYAASEIGESKVAAYSANLVTGELTILNVQPTGSSGACHVSRTSDGKYLLTTGYSDGHISVLALEKDGKVGEIVSKIKHSGRGLRDDRQSEAHPHSVFEDPQHKYIVVSDLGMDDVNLYRLDEGKLVTHREISLPPGSGPRHVAFHPSGKWVYGTNELNSTVTAYAYDATFGDLKILQHASTLPEDVVMDNNTSSHLLVSPCGRWLYASNRGHDSIVQYVIDQDTGMLRAVNWVSSGGKTPRHFNILPGGFLLAANQDSSLIASYRIDPDNGNLVSTGYTLEVTRPVCICPVEKAKAKVIRG
ncbi:MULTISPECIES: lactonase family protein [Paenibacillus]|uniref:6-phosphogluconolactonase n=1 Tax=Paenibacillus lactis TaxID=228574 RepID=A0ABS4F662_9BACL|nr:MULTISPECIES: lactonase family protein [Paenibacillus]MBP1891719.1 6-phosphogluconolactonase [Paenibacillus lactis]MCM3494181.1 lactonase family protein [Paenibacillus lactis]HAF99172.1 lactonase family protein [Paenibacillus lactis]